MFRWVIFQSSTALCCRGWSLIWAKGGLAKAKRPLDCFIYLQFCQISDRLQRSVGVWGDVCVDFNGEAVPGWDSDCFHGVRSGVFVGLVFNGVVLCCWGSLQNCYSLSILGPCQNGETDCFWGWNHSNQLCALSVLFCLLKIEQIFAGVCFCVSYLKLFCVVFQAAIPTPSGGPPLQWWSSTGYKEMTLQLRDCIQLSSTYHAVCRTQSTSDTGAPTLPRVSAACQCLLRNVCLLMSSRLTFPLV